MRITKDPEERRNEILDVAGRLFIKKGYDSVTMSDIAAEIKVAKGTIYYYFKSKEELLDATILRYVVRLTKYAELIANDDKLSAIEKIVQFADIDILTKTDKEVRMFFAAVHPRNAEMKLRRLIANVLIVPPMLAKIIEQGIREKVMYTKHPLEAAELLVAAEKVLFEGLFEYEPDDLRKKLTAYVENVEILLNMEEGALAKLIENFTELSAALNM